MACVLGDIFFSKINKSFCRHAHVRVRTLSVFSLARAHSFTPRFSLSRTPTPTYMSMHIHAHTCMYVCMHACLHICKYVCVCVWKHVCMCVWKHVCIKAWMYACVYLCAQLPVSFRFSYILTISVSIFTYICTYTE